MARTHRILVVGSGGREHALAWRLDRDPDVDAVLVAPGNDGMARRFTCLPVDDRDPDALIRACREQGVTLVVVGPEAPLAAGLSDQLAAAGLAVFGPSREGARLEASKWFAKQLMLEAGIPTARAESHTDLASARKALDHFAPPFVVKADGLAAGKGVRVAATAPEAEAFLEDCLARDRYGEAGRRVVVEEHLRGEEASVIAVCDGREHLLLPSARDYKRARDGDGGPNTGGMGAFAPSDAVDPELERTVSDRIVRPALETMSARGTPFRGALYCGLMVDRGEPRVMEFNCRFGDPETQAILPLLEGSLARALASAAAGRLEADAIGRRPGATVAVALVDEGYPEAPRRGGVLEGLDAVEEDGTLVFHAGLGFEDGRWTLRGGRAAHVVARGDSVGEARARVYAAIARLGGAGWRFRSDIAAGVERSLRGGRAPAASTLGAEGWW